MCVFLFTTDNKIVYRFKKSREKTTKYINYIPYSKKQFTDGQN